MAESFFDRHFPAADGPRKNYFVPKSPSIPILKLIRLRQPTPPTRYFHAHPPPTDAASRQSRISITPSIVRPTEENSVQEQIAALRMRVEEMKTRREQTKRKHQADDEEEREQPIKKARCLQKTDTDDIAATLSLLNRNVQQLSTRLAKFEETQEKLLNFVNRLRSASS